MATNNAINLASSGLVAYDGAGIFTGRTVTGTTNQIAITNGSGTAGNPTAALASIVTIPTQPAFLVTLSGTVSNVTGDGTNYTVAYDTTVFDQGTNITTNNTFTAPITGIYFICAAVTLTGLTALDTSARIDILVAGTANTAYRINPGTTFPASGGLTICASSFLSVTSGQAVTIRIVVGGSTKTVSAGGDTTSNYFCGYLAC